MTFVVSFKIAHLWFILVYFSSIVKQAYVNNARICSWNQPVLSNEDKVSCISRKQQEPQIAHFGLYANHKQVYMNIIISFNINYFILFVTMVR